MFRLTQNIYIDVFSIVVALWAVAYAYCKWSYGYFQRKGLPYIEPLMPFGLLDPPLKRKRINLALKFTEPYLRFRKAGHKVAGFYLTVSPRLIILDPEYIKCVMQKDFNHFVDRGVFVNEKRNPLGAHLFAIGGSKWRFLRTKLTPTFSSGRIKMMYPIVVATGANLTRAVQERVDAKEPVEVKDVLGKYTTDVIGSCAFGLECNSFADPDSRFRNHTQNVLKVGGGLGIFRIMIIAGIPSLARKLNLDLMMDEDRDFFSRIVRETVDYREKNKVIRNDFLQLLMHLKGEDQENPLTLDEIAAQVLVFFLAGFDTSSTTMAFCLYELALNLDIQDRIREELKRVLAKNDGQLTYEALNDLKYMGQAIDETLRKYPPVPTLTRVCTEDYTFPDSDLLVKKGDRITIPVYSIHYDPEYYPNPHVFDPERFSPENKSSIPPFTYLPFGEGPRICIGLRFGVMQSKIGLALLLQKYRFTMNEKTQVPIEMDGGSFTLSAKGGIWLNATEN